MKNKTKILIADDHILFRKWLKLTLNNYSRFEIIGEAKDGFDVIKKSTSLRPDIIILDFEMPHINGLSAASKILNVFPEKKIIMSTMHRDMKIISRCKEAGIKGFILKESSEEDLINVIDEVAANNVRYLINN